MVTERYMQVLTNIRCVVFDLDDTLWPCEPTITSAEQALYSWLESEYPRVTQKYNYAALKLHRAEFAKQHPELAHNVTQLRRQSLAELANKFDYSEVMADKGLALFRKVRNQVTLFDDTLSTLDKLKRKFKLGSITNGNADLHAIGIAEKFDFTVTAENAGVAKPDEKIFKFAQQQAGIKSHQMAYVGDAPVTDMLGAKGSGWQAIWFNPTKQKWTEEIKPNAEVQTLSELLALFSN